MTRFGRCWRATLVLACVSALAPAGWSQGSKRVVTVQVAPTDQPDAERTKQELSTLLERYPPALHRVLALDHTLLANQAYLAPYPSLLTFLSQHPEVARDATFYVGTDDNWRRPLDRNSQIMDMWRDVMAGVAVFAGFSLAVGLIVWLIRTLIDHRRWARLTKVQTDVHTKLLDRFNTNEDLLAYIQSPAGAKFLQSAPISLYPSSRVENAPLGRILWSVQGGIVLIAAGIGLQFVSGRVPDAAEPLNVLGILGIALGLGFVISAIISYVISRRMGLIEPPKGATEQPTA